MTDHNTACAHAPEHYPQAVPLRLPLWKTSFPPVRVKYLFIKSSQERGLRERGAGTRRGLEAWVEQDFMKHCDAPYMPLTPATRSTIDLDFSSDGCLVASSQCVLPSTCAVMHDPLSIACLPPPLRVGRAPAASRQAACVHSRAVRRPAATLTSSALLQR